MNTNKDKKKIIYIAEFSLPNMSAYAVHVLKMCDNFPNDFHIELIIPFCSQFYNTKKIKNDYSLKNNFVIKSLFSSKIKLNLFYRLIFSFKILFYLRDKNYKLIISRSIIPSIVLGLFNYKNILEIHTELTGITKRIFRLIDLNLISKNLKFVVLNSKLIKILKINKKKTIILEDAVESKDFKKTNKKNLIHACAYSGSFAKGKGIDTIYSLAKMLPKIKFHVFGNIRTLDFKFIKNKKPKNLIFKGFISYNKVTKTLPNYKVLLMPYQKKVGVLIKGIDVSNYFSPLKLFEYMASERIILASKLKVYNNILKHNHNSILLNPTNLNAWTKKINEVLKTNNFNFLGKNAKKKVKIFSWKKRVDKIIDFYEK